MSGRDIFQLAFQCSPIILTNGLVSLIPGAMLPIISITQAVDFTLGILDGGDIDLDNCFANFRPMPGATIIDNQIGTYPFANQTVAANAIIAQPLKISMAMTCPVHDGIGYFSKLATMISLQAVLNQHNTSGGTYTVATPSYFYTNCVLTGLRDISGSEDKQSQTLWQWDFFQPLLTLEQAQQAQNSLMSKISSGTQISGDPAWSSPGTTVGVPPSLATLSTVPAASNTAGTGLAGSADSFSGVP